MGRIESTGQSCGGPLIRRKNEDVVQLESPEPGGLVIPEVMDLLCRLHRHGRPVAEHLGGAGLDH